MSMETLMADLAEITKSAGALTSGPDVAAFMQANLLPWLSSFTEEVSEMDEAIEDIVHESPEVLHTESGAVFAAIITSGLQIATELATRAGQDQRLLAIIREFRKACVQGKDLLEEIVIPDDPDDDDDDDDPDEDDDDDRDDDTDAGTDGKGAQEGKAP